MTKTKLILSNFFPCTGSGQQYAHRQETIDTTVLSPHGVDVWLMKRKVKATASDSPVISAGAFDITLLYKAL